MPDSLGKLVDEEYLDRRSLVHPAFAVVPGSDPPSSYWYAPPRPDIPDGSIILYPNLRTDRLRFVYVIRKGGPARSERLTVEEFKREIAKLPGKAGDSVDATPDREKQ